MVWKDVKRISRFEKEKVIKKGDKKKIKDSDFPEETKKFRDFEQFDLEDHQLTEKEKRDLKEMRYLERKGLL